MAITYQSASALAYSATAPVVTLPASIAAGDLLVAFVGIKPSTATCSTPSGWTYLGDTAGGGGTTGADTGPTHIYAFYKVAAGTESGTTVTFTLGTSPNVGWAQAYRLSNATGNWDLGYAGGTDATTGAAWSVTTGSNPGITAGDLCLVGSCIPTDVSTPSQFSAEAISATGISAWGTMTEISEPDSGTGNDIGGFVFRVPVTTGTASAAPVITATAGGTTTNVRGPSGLVRIRESGDVTVNLSAEAVTVAEPAPFVNDGRVFYDSANSPATLKDADGTATTASFTAPAGSLLFAVGTGDSPEGTKRGFTPTDTGSLSWTLIEWRAEDEPVGTGEPGFAEVYWAYAPTAVSRTVTFTPNTSALSAMYKVMVFGNAESSYGGTSNVGASAATGLFAQIAYTTTRANSIVVAAASDWTAQSDGSYNTTDHFDTTLDTTRWTEEDATSSGTLSASSSQLNLALGSGDHDLWDTTKNALIAWAPTYGSDPGNFTLVMKLDVNPTANASGVGFIIQQDTDDWFRVEFLRTTTNNVFVGNTVAGTSTALHNSTITYNSPQYLRIVRTGNSFECFHGSNGTSWTSFYTLSRTLTVAKIGVQTTSSSPDNAAFTPKIDYVTGIPTGYPPATEVDKWVSTGYFTGSIWRTTDLVATSGTAVTMSRTTAANQDWNIVAWEVRPPDAGNVTVSLSAEAVTVDEKAPTVTGDASTTDLTESVAASPKAVTVTAGTDVTITASAVGVTVDEKAPTLSVGSTISLSAEAVVVDEKAPSISGDSSFTATAEAVVVDEKAPTITGDASFSPAQEQVTVAAQGVTASAGVSFGTPQLDVAVETPAVTATGETGSTDATFNATAVSVTVDEKAVAVTGDANVLPGQHDVSVVERAPQVNTDVSYAIPSAEAVTASAPAVTATGTTGTVDVQVDLAVEAVTVDEKAVSVTGDASTTVTAEAVVVDEKAPSVDTGVLYSVPSAEAITVSAPAVTATGTTGSTDVQVDLTTEAVVVDERAVQVSGDSLSQPGAESVTVTARAVTVQIDGGLTVSTEGVAVTPRAPGIEAGVQADASTEAVTVTPRAVTVSVGGDIQIDVAPVTVDVAPQDVTAQAGVTYSIPSAEAITVGKPSVSVEISVQFLPGTPEQITASTPSVAVSTGSAIALPVVQVTTTGQGVSVSTDSTTTVSVPVKQITATPQPASVTIDVVIDLFAMGVSALARSTSHVTDQNLTMSRVPVVVGKPDITVTIVEVLTGGAILRDVRTGTLRERQATAQLEETGRYVKDATGAVLRDSTQDWS